MSTSETGDGRGDTRGRHSAQEHVEGAPDPGAGPGGTAASGGQSEGGGEPMQDETAHTGYGPTDGGTPHAGAGDAGHPAGLAASGGESQGGGTEDGEGRRHTGWGPVDGEVNQNDESVQE